MNAYLWNWGTLNFETPYITSFIQTFSSNLWNYYDWRPSLTELHSCMKNVGLVEGWWKYILIFFLSNYKSETEYSVHNFIRFHVCVHLLPIYRLQTSQFHLCTICNNLFGKLYYFGNILSIYFVHDISKNRTWTLLIDRFRFFNETKWHLIV